MSSYLRGPYVALAPVTAPPQCSAERILSGGGEQHSMCDNMSLITRMMAIAVALFLAIQNPVPCAAAVDEPPGAVSHPPFSAALVIDGSGSMTGANLDACKEGGHNFVDAMTAADEAAVFSFGSTVTLHQLFTSDPALLHGAIDSIKAYGSTVLWDALYAAGTLLRVRTTENRFIVVVSDGADGSSTRSMSEVSALCVQYGLHVVTIALGPGASTAELALLADLTGGCFHAVQDPTALPDLMGRLVDSLVTTITGPDRISPGSIALYPQPARDRVTIAVELEQVSALDLTIHDQTGRIRLRAAGGEPSCSHRCVANTDVLPPGVYFVTVRSGAGSFMHRAFIRY